MLTPYTSTDCYDELFDANGQSRLAGFDQQFASITPQDLRQRQHAAEMQMYDRGITFAVYGNTAGIEKVWPFDIVPRVIDGGEWETIEAGLKQRIRALNLFIDDVYHDRSIIRDKVVPEELLMTATSLRPQCQGLRPPSGVWTHITGTDLVRDKDGTYYVLEDNLRCPSGVSYVLENREAMKRTLPEVFQNLSIRPIGDYPERLLDMLCQTAPEGVDMPTTVVLTPGIFNSAYFEHSFLAQQMGIQLVTPSDLVVANGYVHMHTTRGLQRVDVIYRRIDDDFLDPKCFRADSELGVPGLMDVYAAGRLTLANAPGTGVADDKAIYAYVPKIVKYYLNEDVIIPNVPTFVCSDPTERKHVLANLDNLVVKPTNESGGYGIMLGPRASQSEREECAASIAKNPRNFIAQPMLTLSTVPTVIDDVLEGRHVDLRPFILYGSDIYVMPGGLTRVALKKGSMIVNSSQGGGSKDTWVLDGSAT